MTQHDDTSNQGTKRLLVQVPEVDVDTLDALTKNLREIVAHQRSLAQRCDLICDVTDLTVDDEGFWLTESIGDASSLESLVAQAPIDARLVARYGVQLCDALLAACYPDGGNTQPHGVLRPACVFLVNGNVRVSEFGVAQAFSDAMYPGAAHDEMNLLAPYTSREIWKTPGAYGELRDEFAVGVILFELATGGHPFGVDRTDALLCKFRMLTGQTQSARKINPDLNEALIAVLDRAVAKQEESRYPSIRELREALSAFVGTDPVEEAIAHAAQTPSDNLELLQATLARLDQVDRGAQGSDQAQRLARAQQVARDLIAPLLRQHRIDELHQAISQGLGSGDNEHVAARIAELREIDATLAAEAEDLFVTTRRDRLRKKMTTTAQSPLPSRDELARVRQQIRAIADDADADEALREDVSKAERATLQRFVDETVRRGDRSIDGSDLDGCERIVGDLKSIDDCSSERQQLIDAYSSRVESLRERLADQERRKHNQQEEDARQAAFRSAEQEVAALAERFARDIVRQELPGLLDPANIVTNITSTKWTTSDRPAAGKAQLKVAVRGAVTQGGDEDIAVEFEFSLDAKPPQILDADRSLRKRLVETLRGVIKQTQKNRIGELETFFQTGLFPDADLTLRLPEPSERAAATIHLLGSDTAIGTLQADIEWDPVALRWELVDAASIATEAIGLATDSAREQLKPVILELSPTMQKYRSVLKLTIDPSGRTAADAIPTLLRFACQVSLQLSGSDDTIPVSTLPVNSRRYGAIAIDVDLASTEQALEQIVTARQNAARTTIEQHLRSISPPKTSIVVEPKKITAPIDRVQFSLTKKPGKLTLAGVWNMDTFDFDLPTDTKAQVDKVLKTHWIPREVGAITWRQAIVGGVGLLVTVAIVVKLAWPSEECAQLKILASKIKINFESEIDSKLGEIETDIDEFLLQRTEFHKDPAASCELPPEEVIQGYKTQLTNYRDAFDQARTALADSVGNDGDAVALPTANAAIDRALQMIANVAWQTQTSMLVAKTIEKIQERTTLAQLETESDARQERLKEALDIANNELDESWDSLRTLISAAKRAEHDDTLAQFNSSVARCMTMFDEKNNDDLETLRGTIERLVGDAERFDLMGSASESVKTLDDMKGALKQYQESLATAEASLTPPAEPYSTQGLLAHVRNAGSAAEAAVAAWHAEKTQVLVDALTKIQDHLTPKSDAPISGRDTILNLENATGALKQQAAAVIDPSPLVRQTLDHEVDAFVAKIRERYQSTQQTLSLNHHANLGNLLEDASRVQADAEWVATRVPTETRDKLSPIIAHAATQRDILVAYKTALSQPPTDSLNSLASGLFAAKQKWPTDYVNGLLDAMKPAQDAETLAKAKFDDHDLHGAAYFLENARAAIQDKSTDDTFAKHARTALENVRAAWANSERNRLANDLADAETWLGEKGRGDPPEDNLGGIDLASAARELLDRVGVAFDNNLDVIDDLNVFTDDDREIINRLKSWTIRSLPIGDSDVRMDFVVIPGVPDDAATQPFWMGQTELTVAQFQAAMNAKEPESGGDLPVGGVNIPTWEKIKTALNAADSPIPGVEFALPTTDQWMRAVLAGQDDELSAHVGLRTYDMTGSPQVNAIDVNLSAAGIDREGFVPVRSFAPNNWLLFDMIGNASEWVHNTHVRKRDPKQTVGGSYSYSVEDFQDDLRARTNQDIAEAITLKSQPVSPTDARPEYSIRLMARKR